MEEESSLGEILESTLAVSRGLEALQKEHGALLEQLAGDTTQEEEGMVSYSIVGDVSPIIKILCCSLN